MKYEDLWNLILTYIIAPTFIAFILIYLLFLVTPSTIKFESKCKSLGGIYYEAANVSCNINHIFCANNCILFNHTYNYYDRDLCLVYLDNNNETDIMGPC
jgi:hypothetical protein